MYEIIPIICFKLVILYMAYLQRKLRANGIDALVLPHQDNTQGWLGRIYRLSIVAYSVLVVTVYFAAQLVDQTFGNVPLLDKKIVKMVGAAIMIAGTFIVIWGQHSLGLAWRIGIKQSDTPTLVQTGAFRFSRNPVFVGIFLLTLGYFFFHSNILTAALFSAIFVSINAQVREEEAYLQEKLGAQYDEWVTKTHRWFGLPVSIT